MEINRNISSGKNMREKEQPERLIIRTNIATSTSQNDQLHITDPDQSIQDSDGRKRSSIDPEENVPSTTIHDDPPKRSHKKKRTDGKPKRPLSAYNFFFRDEREVILKEQEVKGAALGQQKEDNESESQEIKRTVDTGEEFSSRSSSSIVDDMTAPSNQPHIHLNAKHVPYQSLTKAIGERWKSIDPDRKRKYQDMAAEDLKRYTSEMKIYEEAQKQPTDQKDATSNNERFLEIFVSQLRSNYTSDVTTDPWFNLLPGSSNGGATATATDETNQRIIPNQMLIPPTASQFQATNVNNFQQVSTLPFHHIPMLQNLNLATYSAFASSIGINDILGNALLMHPQSNNMINSYTMSSIPQYSVNSLRDYREGEGPNGELRPNITHQQMMDLQNEVHQNLLNNTIRFIQLLSFHPQNEEERQALIVTLQDLYRASKTNELEIQSLLLKALQDETERS